MKAKPDISGFAKMPKDPTAFLEGAASDLVDKRVPATPSPAPQQTSAASRTADPPPQPAQATRSESTVQKLFRLRWDTANALRMGAAHQSTSRGKRVTETEIVEALIRAHYKLDS